MLIGNDGEERETCVSGAEGRPGGKVVDSPGVEEPRTGTLDLLLKLQGCCPFNNKRKRIWVWVQGASGTLAEEDESLIAPNFSEHKAE